ncbi:hypothetical protein PanWU01x14_137900, partial [Parasponia andersonii]
LANPLIPPKPQVSIPFPHFLGSHTQSNNTFKNQSIQSERNWNLERPNVREFKTTEYLLDVKETALVLPEINIVAALEIDLDEYQTLVVLAEDRLEEAASPQNLLED